MLIDELESTRWQIGSAASTRLHRVKPKIAGLIDSPRPSKITSRRSMFSEDLWVQEQWLKVARDAPALREDTDLAAWIFTVARNLYRSHQRFAILDRLRGRDAIEVDHSPTPERNAAARQGLARLERALGELSAAHREILLLVGAEGIEPTQAAEILDITPEAARQRLSCGWIELRDQLERTLGEKR